jgi:hypothetical protein
MVPSASTAAVPNAPRLNVVPTITRLSEKPHLADGATSDPMCLVFTLFRAFGESDMRSKANDFGNWLEIDSRLLV